MIFIEMNTKLLFVKLIQKVILIVQIEHINAIRELDEILSTEGVDGSFIGPYDLSGSMGLPGAWDKQEVKDALSIYENTVKKYNKLVGYHVISPNFELLNEKVEKLYHQLIYQESE